MWRYDGWIRRGVRRLSEPAMAVGLLFIGGGEALVQTPHVSAPEPAVLSCEGAVQHPIRVRIEAPALLERGVVLPVRVVVQGTRAVSSGEVRMVKDGGTRLVGPSRSLLRPMAAGQEADAEFGVILPAEGRQFYLQFEVRAESGGATLSRGAVLNLLPDGPADPGRVARTGAGEAVLEFAGRRVAP